MINIWAAFAIFLASLNLGMVALIFEKMLPVEYLHDIEDYLNE